MGEMDLGRNNVGGQEPLVAQVGLGRPPTTEAAQRRLGQPDTHLEAPTPIDELRAKLRTAERNHAIQRTAFAMVRDYKAVLSGDPDARLVITSDQLTQHQDLVRTYPDQASMDALDRHLEEEAENLRKAYQEKLRSEFSVLEAECAELQREGVAPVTYAA